MEKMDLSKLYSADKAQQDTEMMSGKIKGYVDNEKILLLLSQIKTVILEQTVQSKTNSYIQRSLSYQGHLSKGEQELLEELKYKVSHESDHGDSYFEIKW